MSADAPAIGMMRDRVKLFSRVQDAEAEGGHLTVYVPLATVWARLHPKTVRADTFADGRGSTATHTLVLRHRSDLAQGDRATCRGRTYEILAVDDLNGHRAFLTCTCTETSVAG